MIKDQTQVGSSIKLKHDNIDVVFVECANALGDPKETSTRIYQYLCGLLDKSGTASAIDPSLKCQHILSTSERTKDHLVKYPPTRLRKERTMPNWTPTNILSLSGTHRS